MKIFAVNPLLQAAVIKWSISSGCADQWVGWVGCAYVIGERGYAASVDQGGVESVIHSVAERLIEDRGWRDALIPSCVRLTSNALRQSF